LLELLVEAGGEVLFQLVVELGLDSLAHSAWRRRDANPWLAALGYALLGALAGLLSLWIVPRRLLPASPARGVSLVVSPLVTGLLMRAYGEFRRSRDLPTTGLATFWGGATFAFFLALVRFVAMS
jgi:hypothetical protein